MGSPLAPLPDGQSPSPLDTPHCGDLQSIGHNQARMAFMARPR
jgi:hypothetical protein